MLPIRFRLRHVTVGVVPSLFLDTLTNVWGFRDNQRVRSQAASTLSWILRCPKGRARFAGILRPEDMKPITQRQQRYRAACGMSGAWEFKSQDDPLYARETGISIGDGVTEER